MSGKRQQVVFINYALWAGGAEKVVFDLVHGLDRDRFEPYVVYQFESENSYPYHASIPTYSIEKILKGSFGKISAPSQMTSSPQSVKSPAKPIQKRDILSPLRRVYQLLSPSIRGRLRPGERLVKLGLRLSGSNLPEASLFDQKAVYDIPKAVAEIWQTVLILRQILSTFDSDAILVPMMEPRTVLVWLAERSRQRRVIASQHVNLSMAQPLRYPDPDVRAVQEWLFLNACRSADVVTFPSEDCRQDLIQNFNIPPEKVRVMINPVNYNTVQRMAAEPLPPEIREKIGTKTLFVHVARFYTEKNHPLLVEACELLRSKYENFLMLCLGDGPLIPSIQTMIEQKGLQEHIKILGEVKNPYPYMAAARGLVLSSFGESFGLVLIEAMICGAVPISVNCPGGPHEILDQGQYGLLVPQSDAQALADAMWRVAVDDALYQRLRAEGPQRARKYDIPNVVKQWEDLFLELKK